MSNTLTMGSLFDGSGGFPLASLMAGIEPVWAAEIEPFAIRVTTRNFPKMKHYGDISKIKGSDIEPVDIITAGSPCQDLSLAGKRAGIIEGTRSNLFFEFIRIVKEMRENTDGEKPRYIVWENVPGAFSSNKGEDFRAVLEEIVSIAEEKAPEISSPKENAWPYADCIVGDGWSIAYRVFDAQYWGVPQRRKRIFLVADFGSEGAGEILFNSEGLSGYSAESFRAWQEAANCTPESIGETSCLGFDGYNQSVDDVAATLGENCGISSGRNGVMVLNDQGGERMDVAEDKTSTLRAQANHPPLIFENHGKDVRYKGPLDIAPTVAAQYGTGGNNQPFVVNTPKLLQIRCGHDRPGSTGGRGPLVQDNKSATLSTGFPQTLFEPKNWDGSDVSNTLTKSSADGSNRMPDKGNFNCVVEAYGISSADSNAMKSANPESGIYKADTARTLDNNGGNPSCNQGGIAVVEGNGMRPSHKGDGCCESEVMYTLNTIECHAVAFADKAATLSANEGPKGPSSQQLARPEENFVLEPSYGLDRASYNQGKNAKFGIAVEEEIEPPMIARGPNLVAEKYSMTTGSFMQVNKEKTAILAARDFKDPQAVNDAEYSVRRLTPVECARLQGFPDWWCRYLGTDNPSEDEIKFWREVFETHRKIMGTAQKPKTDNQIRKWLKNPHSDSAEYKLWGNGVALPCVYFVMAGIAWHNGADTLIV